MVDVHERARAPGHTRRECLVRILHDRNAARLFDRAQSCRSVVERAGKHDANDSGSEMARRRSEQRIHRRTDAVFRRAVDDAREVAVDHQVMIGRRDVDPAVAGRFAVFGVRRGKPAGTRQDFREHTAAARQVQDDEDGSPEVTRQLGDDCTDRFDTSCRGPDDNEIVSSHGHPLAPTVPRPSLYTRAVRRRTTDELSCVRLRRHGV